MKASLLRFAFGFVVSVLAAFVAQLAGAKVGGLFLAFPAILPATLTLIERREGHAQAVADVRWATIGAIGMIAYAVVMVVLVRHVAIVALVCAMVAWILVSFGLYAGVQTLMRQTPRRRRVR